MGLEHQVCHPDSANLIGGDGFISSSPFQLLCRSFFDGSGNNVELGVQPPCGKNSVDILSIVLQATDQPFGVCDAGLDEYILVGCIPTNHRDSLFLKLNCSSFQLLYYDELRL